MDLQAGVQALLPGAAAFSACTESSPFQRSSCDTHYFPHRGGLLKRQLVCHSLKRKEFASRSYLQPSQVTRGRQLQVSNAIGKPDRPIDRSETLQEDPYGPVSQVMSDGVITTKADVTLDEILPFFEKFTGLPVVDDDGRCVGIVSNVDIYKYLRGRAESLSKTRVSEVMTSPAFVIKERAPVAYAAGLMLQNKVHRLPVVDDTGVVIGIITRTDIYQPLMPPVNPLLHRLVGKNRDDELNFSA